MQIYTLKISDMLSGNLRAMRNLTAGQLWPAGQTLNRPVLDPPEVIHISLCLLSIEQRGLGSPQAFRVHGTGNTFHLPVL